MKMIKYLGILCLFLGLNGCFKMTVWMFLGN